jgi:hypothetical protein
MNGRPAYDTITITVAVHTFQLIHETGKRLTISFDDAQQLLQLIKRFDQLQIEHNKMKIEFQAIKSQLACRSTNLAEFEETCLMLDRPTVQPN